jgi:hypothetical protein
MCDGRCWSDGVHRGGGVVRAVTGGDGAAEALSLPSTPSAMTPVGAAMVATVRSIAAVAASVLTRLDQAGGGLRCARRPLSHALRSHATWVLPPLPCVSLKPSARTLLLGASSSPRGVLPRRRRLQSDADAAGGEHASCVAACLRVCSQHTTSTSVSCRGGGGRANHSANDVHRITYARSLPLARNVRDGCACRVHTTSRVSHLWGAVSRREASSTNGCDCRIRDRAVFAQPLRRLPLVWLGRDVVARQARG